MKAFLIFKKSLKQQFRDPLSMTLTLLTVPFFVFLYWLFFSGQPITYTLLLLNQDSAHPATSETMTDDQDVIEVIKSSISKAAGEQYTIAITSIDDFEELQDRLKNGKGDLGLVVSTSVNMTSPEKRQFVIDAYGDATQPSYHIIIAYIQRSLETYSNETLGTLPVIRVNEHPLGRSGVRSPFDAYVPGLLVFAVIMLIFSSSMAISREFESNTLVRLKMASMGSLDLMIGMSSVQLIQGIISVYLTFLTAWGLGFRSAGSLFPAFVITVIACFASIGIGMVVASISRNMIQSFLISSAAMFLLILFSGVIFPRPELSLFQVGSYYVDLFDILPTKHMGSGMNKVLILGASWDEVVHEGIFLLCFSLLFFGLGGFFFSRSSKSI